MTRVACKQIARRFKPILPQNFRTIALEKRHDGDNELGFSFGS
jgi:hypothetical protein